jgi:hypothetical protein
MKKRSAALIALVLLASCVGDPTEGQGGGDDRNPFFGDGGVGEAGQPCPEDQPKVGDQCPRDFLEETNCAYKIDECTSPAGLVYPEYIYFCCRMTSWALCSGPNQCDFYRPDAPVAPPPAQVDAAPDRPAPPPDVSAPRDAGADAAPDSASDA